MYHFLCETSIQPLSMPFNPFQVAGVGAGAYRRCETVILFFFSFCVQFEASIEENTENVEVMRFKTTDLDQPNTENSQAVFNIVSGNGGGHFKIVTDPKTNEGVLMLVKVSSVLFILFSCIDHWAYIAIYL